MKIRKSVMQDLGRIMEIYASARAFMAEHGNPNQWGATNWPPEALIRQDIADGDSYVCINDAGKILGTFFYTYGPDIEPTYREITDGAWLDTGPYALCIVSRLTVLKKESACSVWIGLMLNALICASTPTVTMSSCKA